LKVLIAAVMDGRIPEELYAQLDPDVAENVKLISGRLRKLEKQIPSLHDSDEFVQLYAKAAGYDTDVLRGGGFVFSRDGKAISSSASRADAFSWLNANKKFALTTDDLIAPYRGETGTKLIAKVKGKLAAEKLSDDTLLGMAVSPANGTPDGKTVRFAVTTMLERANPDVDKSIFSSIRSRAVPEAGFKQRLANIPKMISDYPSTILVPSTLTDDATRQGYLKYLTSFARGLDPKFRDLGVEFAERSAVSEQGLRAAALHLPDGSLTHLPDGWRLEYTGVDGQKVKSLLQTPEETAQALGRGLTEYGLLTEEEVIEQVWKDSGVAISPEVSPLGSSRFVARDSAGEIVAQGDTLTQVFEQRPYLWPRLPEQFGPELYFLGKGKFEFRRTIASGPYSELLRTMNSFGKSRVPASWKVVETVADKKIRIRAPSDGRVSVAFAIEASDTGYRAEFATLKKAREFATNELEGWEGVRRIADTRGYDVVAGPGGKILISTLDGGSFGVVDDLTSAKKILAAAPISESHKALFEAIDGGEFDEAIVRSTMERLETTTTPTYKGSDKRLLRAEKKNSFQTIKNAVDAYVSPAYSALEQEAKRLGRPDIAINSRKLQASTRTMGAQNLKATRVIRAIASPKGKLISRNVSEVLGRVLPEGPEKWASSAKNLGLELTPEHLAVLNGARDYYSRMSDVFGVDTWRYLSEYAPQIRSALTDFRKQGGDLTKLSKHTLMTNVFGSRWKDIPEVRFFAQHTRLDAFMDETRNRLGIVDQMVYYTEQGYREQYLGPVQKKFNKWFQELGADPQIDTATKLRVHSMFTDVLGGGLQDPLADTMQEVSLELTTKLAEGIKALGGVFPKELADKIARLGESVVTPDLPGKFSAMLTHATLGFRPFRGVANMFQYTNTYSVFGADAIEAIDEVTDDVAEKYFRKGIIQQKVFASSAKGIGEANPILEFGLKPQQQSEYRTRAWTAEAAGRSFDRGLGRLVEGTTNWDQFVKESKLNLLDETGVKAAKDFLGAGNVEAAKTLFQTEAVRILMFDYAKENYPLAFRGVVGRAFGKFGIFPVGQVDLYRRIMRSGDPSDKITRAIRLIGASVVTYNAFRAVGVDYSGFLWNDAFGFSGGPAYQIGQDLLNVGSDGPEGSMARRDLARSFLPGIDSDGNFTVPRLIVPGALEINSLIKSTRMAQDDPYLAALTALGATTTKDWLSGGLTDW